MSLSVALIPQYLTAKSPEGLKRLMLLNNMKRGAWIRYQDIQFVNGKWICWFYTSDVDSSDLIQAQKGQAPEGGVE